MWYRWNVSIFLRKVAFCILKRFTFCRRINLVITTSYVCKIFNSGTYVPISESAGLVEVSATLAAFCSSLSGSAVHQNLVPYLQGLKETLYHIHNYDYLEVISPTKL